MGCEKEQDALEEHIFGAWGLVNHCDEFGFLNFEPNSGTIFANETCNTAGCDYCGYVLPFDWSVDAETDKLTIVYDNQSTAQLICGEGVSQNNGIEIASISTSSTIITLQG